VTLETKPRIMGNGCNPGAAQTGDRVPDTGSFRHSRPYHRLSADLLERAACPPMGGRAAVGNQVSN